MELTGSLEGSRSLAGCTSMAMEAANPEPCPENLKLVEEKDSVSTDLEMAHVKLRRATEQINLLEGKLQQAVNENAKLKMKQTEDSKLWQGLDLKLSSIKTLCDQLTETLQQLASQTEQAEEDKKFFEEMLGKNSKDLDEFNFLIHDLSTKLEDAEQKIISARQEMLQIKQEKEEMDRSYKKQLHSNDIMIKEKDSLIKQLEGSVDENKSRLQCMEQELKLKDDAYISLKGNLASSESEKNSLELMNKGHILEIEKLCQGNKDLKELLSSFMVKVTELDEEHVSVSSHVSGLISQYERFYEMTQEEKILMARSFTDKFDHLQSQFVDLTSENIALKTEFEELLSRLIELQITQDIAMVQHVEECQVAEHKIRRLESEAEDSASNFNQLEKLVSELKGRIQKLLEYSTLAENQKKELHQNILKLESDNQELLDQVQSIMEEKSNNAESLQGEITKRDQQINQLAQGINEIHKKYELEKIEITNAEKEKAEKLIRDIENQCNEKISQKKQEYERSLNFHKESHSTMVIRLQQDKEQNESALWDYHKEELQRIQSQAEHELQRIQSQAEHELQRIQSWAKNELRESLSVLRKEHDLQTKSLRMHHEEECQRMQKELELQKSKEDEMWNKRQIIYLFVLTSTLGLVFILQPFLPAAYNRRIIMMIAVIWGIGSIGLPCGMYGTSRDEKDCSRYTGRLIYTLFSVFVIYAFYLAAVHTGNGSAPAPSPSLLKDAAIIEKDNELTNGFCIIGSIVFLGNLWSCIRGWWTGGDRDL